MKIIVGLGNPGAEYDGTRHNFGADVLGEIAESVGIKFKSARFNADTAQFEGPHSKLLLVKPKTFMNLSGEAVGRALGFYKLGVDSLLVVYDDLDLPLGKIKFSEAGSSGGHNGIKSIIEHLSSKDFNRLRLGIGKGTGNTVGHVLSKFNSEELKTVKEVLALAVHAVGYYAEHGLQAAMNRYNQK